MQATSIGRGVWTAAVLAGSAGLAGGQPFPADTLLRYEVRHYSAEDNFGWADHIVAVPGNRIECRAVVSYIGTGTVGGLASITFQPVISEWAGSLLLTNGVLGRGGPTAGIGPIGGSRSTPMGLVEDRPGEYGRLAPWGANATTTSTFLRGHLGTGTASGLLRIAQAHITNWIGEGATSGSTANNNVNGGGGVSIAQIAAPMRLSTDPPYDSSTVNIVVFKFGFEIGGAFDRTMTIGTPNEDVYNGMGRTIIGGTYHPNIRWFATES
jgi:hypothetical protein